jgi:hypothetical protein
MSSFSGRPVGTVRASQGYGFSSGIAFIAFEYHSCYLLL